MRTPRTARAVRAALALGALLVTVTVAAPVGGATAHATIASRPGGATPAGAGPDRLDATAEARRTPDRPAAGALAAVAPTALPRPPDPLPTPAPLPGAPLRLTVADLRPRAPQPGGALQVTGSVANTGGAALRELQVRVRVGDRLATRADLRRADTVLPAYRVQALQPLADLPPGGVLPLDVRVAVDDLGLGGDGVYPLQLEVRGLVGTSSVRQQVGEVSTYLPWFGTTVVDPLRIAWLWPLVDQPRRSPREQMVDDVLAASLADDGRLGRSLAAARSGEPGTCATSPEAPARPPGAPPAKAPPAAAGRTTAPCTAVPVTYAVDPDLLSTAQAMTRPYDVVARGGATSPGTGGAAATSWLASLQAAATTGALLALPYADPDVVALTRGASGLAADVAAARDYGVTVTRDVLGLQPLETVALPPAGRLSDAAYDSLTTGTTRAVVLGDDAVTAPPPGRSTPGTRVRLPPSATSGDTTGLVVDRGLSDLLVPGRPEDPRLAEQRWLVETAMIAAELPARGRTLLVAPPRRGTLDPAVAGAALADTGRAPWMCPVRLSDVVDRSDRCPGAAVPVSEPERTAELAQSDPKGPTLPAELLTAVAQERTAAIQLTGAVVKGGTEQAGALRARMQRAWLRGESSAWRDDRAAGARLVALAAADVADLRGKVSVLTGRVTLTSSGGRVSVAVVNELDLPVTVSVQLRAPAVARLSRASTDVLEVPARTSLPVQVDAQTLTSGRFVVKAQLLDRDGQAFREPADLLVHSTRYGSVALAVTGLGAAVLLIAAGVRVTRRALYRRPARA